MSCGRPGSCWETRLFRIDQNSQPKNLVFQDFNVFFSRIGLVTNSVLFLSANAWRRLKVVTAYPSPS